MDGSLSNGGAELELVLDSRFTSCMAGLVSRIPLIGEERKNGSA